MIMKALKSSLSVLGAFSASLVVSSATAGIVAQIPGPDGRWDYASFDSAGHRILVSKSYGVMALDLATRKLSTVAPGTHVNASIALPNGRILITNEDVRTVTLANGSSGATESTIAVGKDPDAAVFDPASGNAFVMNNGSGDISVIDVDKGVEKRRVPVGGSLEFAVVDGAGKLFVNVEEKAEVAVLDTRTLAIGGHYKLAGCKEPSGLAYVVPAHLLVSACANGHAKIIDAKDGHEVGDVSIGPRPDAVLYDAARSRIYIPTGGSLEVNGEVTVLSVGADGKVALAGRIATQRGARTIAQDPETGLLYLPTADYVKGPRGPKAVDGTFRVLIVSPDLDAPK
jgi:DNA-binding beta-propeller fold protein YncE